MSRSILSRVMILAAAGAALSIHPSAALAQPVGSEPEVVLDTLDPVELLDDMLFYVQINDYRQAERHAAELERRNLTPRQFVGVVQELDDLERFTDVVARARRVNSAPNLRAAADRLEALYEQGRLAKAREAGEITENIRLLTTTARGRLIGADRLVEAGEYAMPQLLGALLQGQDPALQVEVRRVLIRMGRQAVMPLVTALPELSPAQQELVVNLLAQIEYRSWLPYVAELAESTDSSEVRRACRNAMKLLTGREEPATDVATMFFDLGEQFYGERLSVTSFPGEPTQLVWNYNPASGLYATDVRTEAYHEAMTMRLSERSLRHRTDGNDALSLWLAANFSREIDSPAGYANPLYPGERPSALYFATAFGPERAQWVLARALDTADTPLASRAIEAISRTAGGEAMRDPIVVTGEAGAAERRPLVEALDFPNRRVQIEAALALAMSQPTTDFEGSQRVIPILAGAVRNASDRTALVVSADRDGGERLVGMLKARGYEVFSGASLASAAGPAQSVAMIDLVVSDLPVTSVRGLVEEVRNDRRMGATPVLALASGLGFADLSSQYQRDVMVMVRRADIASQELGAAIDDLVERATGGPITGQEAARYSSASLAALRDLALSRNQVFDVADAVRPLIEALGSTNGQTQRAVADVLAFIGQERAQVALVEAALSAGDDISRIELLKRASASAREHGNLLPSRFVGDIVALTLDSPGSIGTEAATLMGSLGLSTDRILPLVVGEDVAGGESGVRTANR